MGKKLKNMTDTNLLLTITIVVFFVMYIGAIVFQGKGFLKPQTFFNILNANAALIKVSRLSSINYSVIAKDIEMDAILAVALGGNSLSGGKFNMAASILGAYVIQFLTTTLYKFDVQSDALPAYKAVVVILLVVLSTPKVREWLSAFGKKLKQGKAVKEVG